ncbi:MAG TPA: hydroxyacid dehydrogenase [Armatimonadota bacterium]|nr:hydroxyacid dehydrogenase [Armatimonadota bacterium]
MTESSGVWEFGSVGVRNAHTPIHTDTQEIARKAENLFLTMQQTDHKIAFFETEDWERQFIKDGALSKLRPQVFIERLTSDTAELAKDAEIVSVFVYSEVKKPTLDQLPNVKLIATRSTGYDHIDLSECHRRNIVVSNVPYYGENTVAEHAFGLILSLSRKIYKAYLRTTRLDFSLESLKGFDLKDKTIGVIGAGRIGLHVVRIAKGFGMNVIVFDTRQEPLLAEVLGFTYVPFEELLQRSDVISLHVPLNPATYHLINKENVKTIKRGAILINTSRGGVVETEALISALNEGIISGAGLDVFEGEESVKEDTAILAQALPGEKMREVLLSYALLHRENVVITPHIAFYSQEALMRIMQTTEENIQGFIQGKPINTL